MEYFLFFVWIIIMVLLLYRIVVARQNLRKTLKAGRYQFRKN